MGVYEDMSRDELKAEVRDRDLAGRSEWTTRDDFIAALEADDATRGAEPQTRQADVLEGGAQNLGWPAQMGEAPPAGE